MSWNRFVIVTVRSVDDKAGFPKLVVVSRLFALPGRMCRG